MDFKLDMTMMFAMHDALRRELTQVGRIARLRDDHPGQLLHAALGWELFKKFLLVHHQSEDDALWPALRAHVDGQPDRVTLVEAMEEEHAAIDPLLTAIDAAMYMPWLLSEASPQTLDAVLSKFPPPLLTAFREQWGPRYATLPIWTAAGEPAS